MVTTGRLRRLAVLFACGVMISCGGAMRIQRKSGRASTASMSRRPGSRSTPATARSTCCRSGTPAPDGILGRGERWGTDRSVHDAGAMYRIALGDVAVFETDTRSESPANLPMAVLTTASVALSIAVIVSAVSFVDGISKGGD